MGEVIDMDEDLYMLFCVLDKSVERIIEQLSRLRADWYEALCDVQLMRDKSGEP